ncbi:uncharacterized protein BO66DRAFT_438624 [Aspergillus aculeatinus CBS 121060]|uniref:Uncharacterized protein n=1 Tax=Aspergillus aculeatinus CBS 121060 TaxID=1448322 RepID=A0ACD1H839_9EURO|nr:hypothetical protein BO66DRAFT_438624 [Aspergillus aculeatinus CBS 121060]RAH69920.1 hypothetical protein BO66DRAFT_438624 [Aspergillus aculeatinus CBS 121060]
MSSTSETESLQLWGERKEVVCIPPSQRPTPPHKWTALYAVSRPLPSNVSTVRFSITSHDQGWGNARNGLWSWFEVSILGSSGEQVSPEFHDLSDQTYVKSSPEDFGEMMQEKGLYLKDIPKELTKSSSEVSMTIIKNTIQFQWQHRGLTWKRGCDDEAAERLLDLLDEGDRLVIWARAQFPGWVNCVKEAQIMIATSGGHQGVRPESDDRSLPVDIPTEHSGINRAQVDDQSMLEEPESTQATRPSGTSTQHGTIDQTQTGMRAVFESFQRRLLGSPPSTIAEDSSHISPNQHIPKETAAPQRTLLSNCKPSRAAGMPYNWLPMVEWILFETAYDDPSRPRLLWVTGLMYMIRCAMSPQMGDVGKALAYLQLATLLEPQKSEYRAHLVLTLLLRYSRTERSMDLDQAIIELEKVMASSSEWPGRLDHLKLFATAYEWRHANTGNPNDLQKASKIIQELHDATAENSPDRAIISDLQERHKARTVDDLAIGKGIDIAIEVTEHALARTPRDNKKYQELVWTLSQQYFQRYNQTGHTEDLELAISRAEQHQSDMLEDKVPIVSAGRDVQLATYLMARWIRQGCHDDLTTALTLMKRAIDATVPGSTFQVGCIIQRAAWMSLWPNGADRIELVRTSIKDIESIRTSSFDRISGIWKRDMLWTLGLQYWALYQCTQELADIEKAIESLESSLDFMHEPGSMKISAHRYLGELWLAKASRTRDNATYRRSMRYFLQCCLSDDALPMDRVLSARAFIHRASHAGYWEQACVVAATVFPLVPLVSSRDLKHDDKIYNLRALSGLASDACAAFLNLGFTNEALVKVELGRGILLGDLFDIQSNLCDLQRAYPDLAQEYERLRHQALYGMEVDELEDGGKDQQINDRRAHFQRLQKCEDRIRERAGFETFLQPLTSPQIGESAREGPIIIVNASCVSCDALLIASTGIGRVRLDNMISHAVPQFRQHLTRCALKPRARDLESDLPAEAHDNELLSWLWYTCVKPILGTLASHNDISTGEEKTRVWWMGVGAASGLPFHAAGDYSSTEATDASENCLDHVISSYTPTIKALRNARERATQTSRRPLKDNNKPSLLIATMPDTPGHGALHGVRRESQAIKDTIAQAMDITELAGPSTGNVLSALQNSELVHFACHGYSDPGDPANSHLLLQKSSDSGMVVDKLTVSKLLDTHTMSRAWIAYLSACSTAEIRDRRLLDEGLHITSGFLIAGFSHVIGSLWPAEDEVCVHMATYFYEALLARRATATDPNRAVAEAVRDATLRIRSQYWQNPLAWALYTHVGA